MKTGGGGDFGAFAGCMWISRGSRLPLRRLQGGQAATMFSQIERPPRERGMTWSTVRPDLVEPQYWQVQSSRARTARRGVFRRGGPRGGGGGVYHPGPARGAPRLPPGGSAGPPRRPRGLGLFFQGRETAP